MDYENITILSSYSQIRYYQFERNFALTDLSFNKNSKSAKHSWRSKIQQAYGTRIQGEGTASGSECSVWKAVIIQIRLFLYTYRVRVKHLPT